MIPEEIYQFFQRSDAMINYLTKDITTVDRGIIAHGCNCQGVMGSGVARFLRDKYPQIFPEYAKMCVKAINDKKPMNESQPRKAVNIALLRWLLGRE